MTKTYSADQIEKIRSSCSDVVDMWENHDKYREMESDKALYPEGFDEPWDVVLSRLIVKYDEAYQIEPGEYL